MYTVTKDKKIVLNKNILKSWLKLLVGLSCLRYFWCVLSMFNKNAYLNSAEFSKIGLFSSASGSSQGQSDLERRKAE